ncbi:hypothetical protein K1W54_29750 [Micromonospora sp. CPCC 205371]|nr:hypothetical protein [Micromonospora sp. CPCC 205371]
MDPAALITHLRDELQRSGHPAINEVADLDSPGVRIDFPDGVRIFAKVAWYGRADQQPHQPSWPSREDLTRAGARR